MSYDYVHREASRMYQFQNPANDFYLRNAQVMQQGYAQQFPYQRQQAPQVSCRFVTSIDEAKAAMIDPLSTSLFLDSSTGRIYLKRILNSGQAEFISYSIEQQTNENKADPIEEIRERLLSIEKHLGEMRNDKSVPNDGQPGAGTGQPATSTNAADDGAESAGFQKNAGNDKWKKR